MEYPKAPLSTAIKHRKEFIEIDDTRTYKRCRVQLHAKGILLRDEVLGSEIKTKRQQVCRAGELLVAEIDAKVGGYGIVPEELSDAIVSSHYFLFEIDEEMLDRRYLGYYIQTPDFRNQVTAQGSTNYAAIRPQNVLDYLIPLPSISEQRRIVARIEPLREKLEEAQNLQLAAAKESAVIVRAVARTKLAGVDAEISELRSWIIEDGIQTGPFGAQLGSGDFIDSGIPVLTIGNVQFGGLRLNNLKHVSPEKASLLSRYAIRAGDILFARMGTVGRCCVVPEEAHGWLINYHIIRVTLDQTQVDPRYIHWTIQASADVEQFLEDKIRGATREGVNSTIVGSLPCRVPHLSEQRRIVAQLDALQAKSDLVRQLQADTQAELDALLPAILNKAFQGNL